MGSDGLLHLLYQLYRVEWEYHKLGTGLVRHLYVIDSLLTTQHHSS